MNWDEKSLEAGEGRFINGNEHIITADDQVREEIHVHAFSSGAKWQRDQLRTDEAVERLALRLMNMMTPFDEWPTNKELGGGPTGDCDVEFKQAWMDETRAAIATLLGEDV